MPDLDYANTALMSAAARIAEGFRSFFNSPDVRCLVETRDTTTPYWREVLSYCMQGNLQSVLDEYAHFLMESLGDFCQMTYHPACLFVRPLRCDNS